MAEGTKERILRTALELFAQNGYLGTSMNDIAGQLGFTKAALYKHYVSKQEILDKIVERMNKMDYERAEAYEMPETEPDGFAEAYMHTPIQKIRTYSLAQFVRRHIVGGENRTLISVKTPLRLCRTGTCRKLSAERPQIVVALFERQLVLLLK